LNNKTGRCKWRLLNSEIDKEVSFYNQRLSEVPFFAIDVKNEDSATFVEINIEPKHILKEREVIIPLLFDTSLFSPNNFYRSELISLSSSTPKEHTIHKDRIQGTVAFYSTGKKSRCGIRYSRNQKKNLFKLPFPHIHKSIYPYFTYTNQSIYPYFTYTN